MDALGFDFIEDNGQKPVTKFLEGWIEQVMQASDDIVVLHEGKWFDPNKMAAADEYSMHVLVLTGKLWPTNSIVNAVFVKKNDSDEDSAWEDTAPAPVLRNELSWLRGILPTLRGNVKSKVKCRLRALEFALPHVNKDNYILQREFFAEVGRLTRLVIKWKNKQGNYNDILKQRWAYLDTSMVKLTGAPAKKTHMSIYYAEDPVNKDVVGQAVVSLLKKGPTQMWHEPAGYDRGQLQQGDTVDVSFQFNPTVGEVTSVESTVSSSGDKGVPAQDS